MKRLGVGCYSGNQQQTNHVTEKARLLNRQRKQLDLVGPVKSSFGYKFGRKRVTQLARTGLREIEKITSTVQTEKDIGAKQPSSLEAN